MSELDSEVARLWRAALDCDSGCELSQRMKRIADRPTADQVRGARLRAGLRQVELGALVGGADGCAHVAVSRLERHRASPTVRRLAHIAAALDTVFVVGPWELQAPPAGKQAIKEDSAWARRSNGPGATVAAALVDLRRAVASGDAGRIEDVMRSLDDRFGELEGEKA